MDTGNQSKTPDYDVNYNNIDYGNYNPDEIDVDQVINVLFVIDTSSSITSYVHELNDGINDFLQRMQKSHHANNIFTSFLEFSSANNINVSNGFQPITSIPPQDFNKNIGGCAMFSMH